MTLTVSDVVEHAFCPNFTYYISRSRTEPVPRKARYCQSRPTDAPEA